MSLSRFKTAQASPEAGFQWALEELEAGEKRSHWIWYIFPQLVGLGRSSTARFYGLQGRDEAIAYLREPELFERLHAVTCAVARHLAEGVPLVTLMGGTTDALKLVSSLTLFERIAQEEGRMEFARRCAEILSIAERQGHPRCEFTLRELNDSTDAESKHIPGPFSSATTARGQFISPAAQPTPPSGRAR